MYLNRTQTFIRGTQKSCKQTQFLGGQKILRANANVLFSESAKVLQANANVFEKTQMFCKTKFVGGTQKFYQ